jgi:DNA-binding MarR family transcriptional regulator
MPRAKASAALLRSSTPTPVTESAAIREVGRRCACFNLRRVTRAVTQVYDDFLRPTGLRVTQFSVLVALRNLHQSTVNQLADKLVVDRTTLTRNLRPLEDAGLVRTRPGADRRVREIFLTTAGEEKLQQALPLWREAQSQMRRSLGRDRLERLLSDLSTTLHVVRDREQGDSRANGSHGH